MSHRRTALALLALTGPLAATLVVSTATAALASASWDGVTPADGAKLSSSSFTVRANVDSGSSSVTLTLTSKANGTSKPCTLASNGGLGSGAQTLKIDIPSSGACSTTKNTQWTATLSGGATGTRTFSTNVAPAAPTGFSASGSGSRDVAFSWTKGSEPDLTGYALYESGTLVDGSIPVCSSSTCTYSLYYSTDKPGDHSYQLAARRASGGCSSCGSYVESGSRASATATLTDPPKPSPSPSPSTDPTPSSDPGTGGTTGDGSTGGTTDGSTGGSTSGSSTGGSTGGTSGSSTGGSTSGGSTSGGSTSGGKTSTSGGTAVNAGPKPTLPTLDPIVAQRRAFALRFNAFSPSLGIPKLPPLPSLTLPTTSREAPLPLGTYNPQLPYPPVTETEKISDGTLARPVAAVRDGLDSDRLARSIAGALILLLIGAHLRRFLATQVDD